MNIKNKFLNFNKILILLGILILMFGLSSIVRADTAPTCSFVKPIANTAYNGTIVFNATTTSNGTGVFNVTGINFTVSSVVVGSSTLKGVNQTYYNATVDTTLITDIKQTTVTANIIINYTTLYGSCTSTGVDFDNTAPVCSQTIDFEQIDILKPLTVDCSDSTDTTDITYSIVLTLEDATTSTETPSDGITIFEQGQTGVLGWATAVCTVTDEVTKSTACTSNSIWIGSEEPTTPSPDVVITPPGEEEDNIIIILTVGIAIVVVIIILIIIFTTKKKGKRR